MDATDLLALFDSLVAPVRLALAGLDDPHAGGARAGQYAFDLVADGEIVGPLIDAGLGVLSEESGTVEGRTSTMVVVDPVDGSTNAALGLPWYALSLCAVDRDGPVAAMVVNLATDTHYRAIRGEGATRDDTVLTRPAPVALSDAVVGVSGLPPSTLGWGQFRALGAAALDLCAVAAGELHGYVDCSSDAHGVWDYAGAWLVCREVGVEVVDALGRNLLEWDHRSRRTPVAAPDPLVDELVTARRRVMAA